MKEIKDGNELAGESLIGKNIRRVDAHEKVTGRAVYGDDIQLTGMLFAAVRYTDIPSGKITRVDISEAEKIPGVKAIARFQDIPGQKRLGPIRADQYALVDDEVFYSGDVIAAVAAETKEAAYLAADLIKVEYAPVAGIFDPREAIKPSSRLIHPEFKSNIMVHYPLRKGDVKSGFEQSDHVLERDYQTGFHEHAYIEPESVTAVPDPVSQGFKIYGSIQNPYTTRKVIALFMGLELNRINVFGSTLGGSFGGKDDIINYMGCRVALLAKMTGKPVKLTYQRENSLKESYKRHPYYLNYKVGFSKSGKLNAMKIKIIADCGAYSSQTFFVTWRSVVQATGPYEIENVETDIYGVYTNNTYTAAFRGFGSPQIIFAQESLMDEIAEICGISPVEIRKLNAYRQGSITASGQKLDLHKVSLLEVMNAAIERSNYYQKIDEYHKLNEQNSRFAWGIGLSCSFRGCSLGAEGTDATSAIVSVQADGSVYVLAGLNENGQGMRTAFSQIAAEVLSVPMQKIVFLEPQTAVITDGGPTVASRGTITGGNAVLLAAREVKKRIFEAVKEILKENELEKTIWQNGMIRSNSGSINFTEAAEISYRQGVNLSAYGWWNAPAVNWHEETGQGNAYFTYVYGCQIAEIKLDKSTGKIDVIKVTAAHDVGKVINRMSAEGQITGGVLQGIGYAVLEDFNIQQGIVKSANLDEYLIPTIKDIGAIDPVLIENEDKFGPFGAKSLGEPTLELTSAAINNAFKFATGQHSYEIPLTLEKVFLNKQLRKPSRQSEIAFHESCRIHDSKKQSPRLNNLSVVSPANLEEALHLLSQDEYLILGGGTDVLIGLRQKTGKIKLINIFDLPELKGIFLKENGLIIKGTTTFSQIVAHPEIVKHFPLLVQACRQIGSTQIRNRATIAGNIVNAAPCADSYPPLLLYDAVFTLQSHQRKRRITAADFIIRNYETQIQKNEILSEIFLPFPAKNFRHHYFQLGRRKALNITRLSLGILIEFEEDKVSECRIVCGSLFNRPVRLTEIETMLENQKFCADIIEKILPPLRALMEHEIGGRWSSEYKIPVFMNMMKNGLNDILVKKEEKK